MTTYYARTDGTNNKANWQLLKDHLKSVAFLSAEFADKFKSKELGNLVGLLHDLGKYLEEFQKRLEDKSIKVTHSDIGAMVVYRQYKAIGKLLAYIIAGHHTGLPDHGSLADKSSLKSKLAAADSIDISKFLSEIGPLPPMNTLSIPLKTMDGFSISFFVRMLYSCLVDADSLDAEKASGNKNTLYRKIDYDLQQLENALFSHMKLKMHNAKKSDVNKCRREIYEACVDKATFMPGLYSLTVPTGGGKTLASLAFALKHARINNLERIIYVIPYTSIIEQNAGVFADVLGEEYILEHHSNYQFPEDENTWTDTQRKLFLATENWDAPIVVTTSVQFYETLFSAKRSRCRKLHNMANSVIIIDEAQTMPTGYLKPCLKAISELVKQYNSSVVLCTATQPAINRYMKDGLNPIELMNNPTDLFNRLKRVDYNYIGKINDTALINKLRNHGKVLCIVNTKRHAAKLYSMLNKNKGVYHLSANMCPAHRKVMLEKIRVALKNPLEPCIVISTQLIEAGVDVDFPVVYRALSGIDSIAQGGGRCNREGSLATGKVYIFYPEQGIPKGWLNRTADIARIIINNYDDPLSLEAIEDYFNQLYCAEGDNLDKENILGLLDEGLKSLSFQFREISDKFRIIDEDTMSVIIPWDDNCRKILDEVRCGNYSRSLSRRLQPYTVQVYEDEYEKYVNSGLIEDIDGVFKVLKTMNFYSEDVGLLQAE